MKCGTTSLDYYLKAHPQISMPAKELDFFSVHSDLGLEWYKSKFRKNQNTRVFGETSVSYAKYPDHLGVPKKIYSVSPEVKLIYIVRDPIDRIISHYMHNVYADAENRSFNKVFEEEGDESLYIYFSLYYLQIEKYLEYFPASQIVVISLDDLKDVKSRLITLKNVFKLLNVDQDFESSMFFEVKYQTNQKGGKKALARIISAMPFYGTLKDISSNYIRELYMKIFTKKLNPPVIPVKTREKLIEIIRPDTERLRSFTGNAFRSWCL